MPRRTSGEPIGRPANHIPRRQRHVYMAEETVTMIKRYQSLAAQRGENCSISDAVERLIEVGDAVHSKPRYVPAEEVLGSVPGACAPAWIQIDANNGKSVRCRTCEETYDVPASRFIGYVKGIGKFIEAHRDCGNGNAKEETE